MSKLKTIISKRSLLISKSVLTFICLGKRGSATDRAKITAKKEGRAKIMAAK